MAKVIIGIHGLGNKPPKSVLEEWWKLSIEEGFKKMGKPISPFKFELVYWADVMYNKPLDNKITDKDDPFYLNDKYFPSPKNFIVEEHPRRKIILDYLTNQIDSLFLNPDFSLNYTYISDTILRHYFKDLDIYYKEKCKPKDAEECKAKEIIRQRTAEIIGKYQKDEILIIGHSMGSIIAYDVLSFLIPNINIDTFITLGSPLGILTIKSKIAAERKLNHINTTHLTTPAGVTRNWYNLTDIEDKVAYNYKLSDDFSENKHNIKPVDYLVNNDYMNNEEKNPHKSYGYLRTPQFSEKLNEFLLYRKPKFWEKWWRKFIRLFKQLLHHINRNLLHR